MSNLFQPWVLLRTVSAIVVAVLFARASTTGLRVLRHFDVSRSSEGQLALERRLELAATYARVGAIAAALDCAFGVLVADRLSHSLRGAMCAYGVFATGPWGTASLGLSLLLAVGAGVLAQLYAYDATLPRFDFAKPLMGFTVALAPLACLHAAATVVFFDRLDLSAAASCCSVELDGAALDTVNAVWWGAGSPRAAITGAGALSIAVAIAAAFTVAHRPTRVRRAIVAALGVIAAALGTVAIVLGVAPHVFETPNHLCPFCLLRSDAYAIGYPLFGALYLGLVWVVGAAVAGSARLTDAAEQFAAVRLRRGAIAWAVALLLGMEPVLRYAWSTGGALLFR